MEEAFNLECFTIFLGCIASNVSVLRTFREIVMTYVIRVTPDLSRALVKLSSKYGYTEFDVGRIDYNHPYLHFYPVEKVVNSFKYNMNNDRLTTLQYLIELFESPKIVVGNYEVKFQEDGSIEVGCESISYELLNDIHKKATEFYEESNV